MALEEVTGGHWLSGYERRMAVTEPDILQLHLKHKGGMS